MIAVRENICEKFNWPEYICVSVSVCVCMCVCIPLHGRYLFFSCKETTLGIYALYWPGVYQRPQFIKDFKNTKSWNKGKLQNRGTGLGGQRARQA